MNTQSKYSITRKKTINAPLDTVWAIISDFDNPHLWAPGVSDAYKIGLKDKEVGAKRFCKLTEFGSIEEEIIQWTEKEGYTYVVTPLGPLTNTISHWQLNALTVDTTQLDISINYDIRFSVIGKLLHNLVMKRKLQQSVSETLQALQRHIEKNSVLA